MSIARTTEIRASGASIEAAIQHGVERSCKRLENVESVWIKDIKAKVDQAKVTEYRVEMKVSFILKD